MLHLPLRYEDHTHTTALSALRAGDTVQAEGVVRNTDVQYRPRRQLVCLVEDDDGAQLVLRFFSFYPSHQKSLAAGQRVRVFGEVRDGHYGLEIVHPQFKAIHGDVPLDDRLTPVYPTTAGLSQDTLRKVMVSLEGDIKYPVNWTTLAGYLDTLVARGISTNVASFVGATTVREHVIGWDNRAPTPAELERMQALVRQAMEEGALGVGSSLIYTPAGFAKTPELVALMKAAAPYGGMYITHMRSEADQLLEAIDEALRIGREGGVPVEIYHLKAGGRRNWPKMAQAIAIAIHLAAMGR